MAFRLLIGTQNRGKLREYIEIFTGLPLELVTLEDAGLGDMDVAETGKTFAENAALKATAYANAAGLFALADDSGLCVNALDGRPGVYSARYAGEGATDADRRTKLLSELNTVPQNERGAYFECVVAVCDPTTGETYTATGRCNGRIASEESDGKYGFGYDPVFIPSGYDVTMADIPPTEKHELSHRGRAAKAVRPTLEALIEGAS